jgi:hypothetical protein
MFFKDLIKLIGELMEGLKLPGQRMDTNLPRDFLEFMPMIDLHSKKTDGFPCGRPLG